MTTNAGRRVHRMLFGEWNDAVDGPKRLSESDIADIEAEKEAEVRARLAAEVEALGRERMDADMARLDARRLRKAARALVDELATHSNCPVCLSDYGCMPDCEAGILRAALDAEAGR